MEGLSKQLQLLNAALQLLDLNHASADDSGIVSELQVALARATALAQWAAVDQEVQRANQCMLCQKQEKRNARTQRTTPSSGGGKQLNGTAHTPHAQDNSNHRTPPQHENETLLSIATALRVSVEELRSWNPQLPPTLHNTDVLPTNTFLKVRHSASALLTASPLLSSQPAAALRSPPVTQPAIPRLAAPAATSSRSITRSSSGQSFKQRSQQRNGQSTTAAAPQPTTRTSLRSLGSSASNPAATSTAANATVTASVSSNVSSSVSRLSWGAGESGRGASHSPQVPEPSMPGDCSSADPPHCAPAPVMLGMVEVLPPSAELDLPGEEAGEGENRAEPSPSPEMHADEAPLVELAMPPSPASAAVPTTAHDDDVAPPQPRKQVPSMSPQSPAQQLPQQEAALVTLSGSSPRRASAGASSSGTSTHEIRTRGHSQSLSRDTTPPKNDAATATTAAAAPATSGSSKTNSNSTGKISLVANLPSSQKGKAARTRMAPETLADAKEGGGPSTSISRKTSEGEELSKRAVRDASVSLSAVSATTSCSAGGEERVEPHAAHTHYVSKAQPRTNSPLLVTSPSLEAPSSTSSASPSYNHNHYHSNSAAASSPSQPKPTPSTHHTVPVPMESEKAVAKLPSSSAATATAEGLDFSTPLQQQRRRLSPCYAAAAAAAAKDTSCSPISPSSYASSSHAGEDAADGVETEEEEEEGSVEDFSRGSGGGGSGSGGGGFDRDEVEDTPSTRIPATLGRHVCSPPPTLSRTRRLSAAGATASANTGAKTSGSAHSQGARVASPRQNSSSPPSTSPPKRAAEVTESAASAVQLSSDNDPKMSTQQSSPRNTSPGATTSQERHSPSTPQGEREGAAGYANKEQSRSSLSAAPLSSEEPVKSELPTKFDAEDEVMSDSVYHEEQQEEEKEEVEEEYDTLEGIAAAYRLTVAVIVAWNPYLKKYHPAEPLPPDLPIVLPMSDNDDDDEQEEEGEAVADQDGEEDELYVDEDLHPVRYSGTPLDTGVFTTENSPAPIPPPC